MLLHTVPSSNISTGAQFCLQNAQDLDQAPSCSILPPELSLHERLDEEWEAIGDSRAAIWRGAGPSEMVNSSM